jgi:hypothetical protein
MSEEARPDLDAIRLTRPDLMSLKVHGDPRGFTFLYPEAWHRFTFDAGNGPGVLFAAAPDDFGTHVSLEVSELPTAVTPDDLPELEKAFLAGLRRVPKSKLTEHTSYEVGSLVGLDAQQTFEEAGLRRKRWIRLVYQGSRQARLVAQGATTEEFERWRVKFEPLMTSFDFGDGGLPLS